MVSAKILVTVALVTSLVGMVQPYSGGPPTSVCESMMPSHGVSAQTGQSGYSIEVDTTSYTVFSLVHVTIRGGNFKGIMLQARRAAGGDPEPLGSFFNIPSTVTLGTLSCQDDDDTLVHTSGDNKGSVTVTWAASSVYGNVQFVATIVQARTTFWTSVTSETVFHFTGGVITNPAVPAVSCTRPVDLLFIVDSSDVMLERVALHGQNWDLLTDFLESFVSNWGSVSPSTTRVAVMTYGATVRVDIELSDQLGLEEVLDAILSLQESSGGDVQLESALTSARDVFLPGGNSRGGVPNIACLIMGQDPDNIDGAVTAAENLQNDDVILNVIGATLKAKRSTVRKLLINPLFNYNYWLTVGFESLPSVSRSLTLSLSDQMECEPESIVIPTGPDGSTGATGVIPPDRPDVGDQPELACPVDVAILLDSSGSICNNKGGVTTCNNWELIKEFARQLAELLLSHPDPKFRARIAIIRFSLNVYPEVALTDYISYTTDLEDKIADLEYANSWTNTPEAFKTVKDSVFTPAGGDREDIPNVIIILTDGQPKIGNVEQAVFIQQTLDAAQELKTDGVNILSIGVTYTGVTDFISETVLKGISSPPQRLNENYWKARDFDSLAVILSVVSNYICGYDPPVPCTTDVVFVLDYSSSLGRVVYEQITQFVSRIINIMDLEKTTRVGLVVFSDEERLGFNLDEYQSNSAAAQAVLDVRYVGGKTNTGAAIEYMRNTMFTSGNGDRSDVDNVAVVITDGGSNVPDKVKVIEESRAAKKQGIHMIAVGIGPWLDEYEINAIASYPASINTRIVPDVDELPGYVNSLKDLICNEEDNCEDDNPCQNGGTCVDGFGMYWCQCQAGDAGPDCTQTCREPADIAFAFDVSGSVGGANVQKEISFLADVINNGLNLNDFSRVAVEDFADSANVRFYLNEYNTNKQVLDGLDFFYGGGSTNTADALDKMDNDIFTSGNGDRSNRPNAGVIITDGKSNNPSTTWQNARQLRADGTHLISIGVGTNARQSELEAIASYPPQSNVFNADDFDSVGTIRGDLIDLLCNNVDDCDPNPCQNSGTCTDLIGGYMCSCRDGFTGTNCERGCSGVIDLVFIFDGSRGMKRDRFGKVLEFASNIVSNMEVAADKTRVAAILYGEDATVAFELDTYTSQQDVIAHVKMLKYRRGKSNTAAALRTLIDDVMKDGSVRDDAQKICIIITNAKSNVDKELTLPYATEAKNAGIHMISVGVGQDVDVLEMNGLASRPQTQNVFKAPSWRDLDGIVDGVVAATCDDQDSCDNAFCQNGDCQDGFGTYVCECESEFTGRLCNRRCTSQMDLVFVLDLSGSVDTDYDLITSFTEGVIYGLNMNLGRTRIGIVIFSDDADVWVFLDDYTDKEAVLNAITFPKTGGKTYTELALGLLRTDVFINSAGDRPGVVNRAVIITDGKSTEESRTVEEAKDLRDDGVEIFVVALGGTPRMSEVNEMATDPDSDHVVKLPDTNGLSSAVDELLTQLCQ